uniref:Uncharacterized protein n=1 Tax=Glossina pallidipes TaxID=7398 RepID=A0A1A9ZTY4_GLOPL
MFLILVEIARQNGKDDDDDDDDDDNDEEEAATSGQWLAIDSIGIVENEHQMHNTNNNKKKQREIFICDYVSNVPTTNYERPRNCSPSISLSYLSLKQSAILNRRYTFWGLSIIMLRVLLTKI